VGAAVCGRCVGQTSTNLKQTNKNKNCYLKLKTSITKAIKTKIPA
jgi:hypothetical protein